MPLARNACQLPLPTCSNCQRLAIGRPEYPPCGLLTTLIFLTPLPLLALEPEPDELDESEPDDEGRTSWRLVVKDNVGETDRMPLLMILIRGDDCVDEADDDGAEEQDFGSGTLMILYSGVLWRELSRELLAALLLPLLLLELLLITLILMTFLGEVDESLLELVFDEVGEDVAAGSRFSTRFRESCTKGSLSVLASGFSCLIISPLDMSNAWRTGVGCWYWIRILLGCDSSSSFSDTAPALRFLDLTRRLAMVDVEASLSLPESLCSLSQDSSLLSLSSSISSSSPGSLKGRPPGRIIRRACRRR